jgi:YidC/Oxa1 family membrane protein insertase
MTDIRRSILWVIFGFSMVLLWDKWQVHNGNKATFFPQPTEQNSSCNRRSRQVQPMATCPRHLPCPVHSRLQQQPRHPPRPAKRLRSPAMCCV